VFIAIALILLFSLPGLVTLGPFFEIPGVLTIASLAFLIYLRIQFTAEKKATRLILNSHFYGHFQSKTSSALTSESSRRLQKTWEAVLEHFQHLQNTARSRKVKVRVPRLEIVNDPVPCFWTLKSFGSAGTLILSEGFLHSCNEETLRETLLRGLQVLTQRSLIRATTYAYFLERFRRIGSKELHFLMFGQRGADYDLNWLEKERATPWNAFLFLLIFPIQWALFRSLSDWRAKQLAKIFHLPHFSGARIPNCEVVLNELNLISNYG